MYFHFYTVETLLRQREDGIRIFIQEFSQLNFNEDEVILDLQAALAELTKARMAIPPTVVELHDLSELNRIALERAQALLTSQEIGVSHESIHVRFSDLTPSPEV